MQKIIVPKLGQTMEEATIEQWHKKEGDSVSKGDVILEITTDKATLEVESFVEGTLRKVLAPEGITLPVNTCIALVGTPDEEMPADLKQLEATARGEEAAPAAARKPAEATAWGADAPEEAKPESAPAVAPTDRPAGRLVASPRARRLAEKERVPLSILQGSGPGGRIVERDVNAYLERRGGIRITPAARVSAVERGVDVTAITGTGPGGRITREDVIAAPVAGPAELSAMQRIVADRMSASKREVPHFYLFMDADMTEAVALRRQLNDEDGSRVAYHDLLVKACAMGLAEQPAMNVAWESGGIRQRSEANIGLAVALDEGLMVPVVHRADRLSLKEIAGKSRELIEKARSKRLTPDEYDGGCLTISNLGMYDVDSFLPIVNPGESAIMGVGRIRKRPVVAGEEIQVRSMMTLSLSADHRIVDGAIAAQFLKRVKDLLEQPAELIQG